MISAETYTPVRKVICNMIESFCFDVLLFVCDTYDCVYFIIHLSLEKGRF